MIQWTTLARPYAKAAFEWAIAEHHQERWDAFLVETANIAKEPSVAAILKNPEVDSERILQIFLALLDDRLKDAYCIRFLSLLIDRRRIDLLPFISKRFQELQLKLERKIKAEISTAFPLSEAQKDAIVQSLGERFHCRAYLKVQVDAGLLAGAVIRVGNRVLDRSVLTSMKELAKTLRGEKA